MLAHYLAAALHRFRRDPAATAVKVLALALGLASFLVAHVIADHVEQTDRHWAAAGRIIMLSQTVTWPSGDTLRGSAGAISGPALAALREDFPEAVLTAVSGSGGFVARAQGRVFDQGVVLAVDPTFTEVFDLAMRHGSAQAALDAPRAALIEESFAREVFQRTDVVGETLEIRGGVEVTIAGVFAWTEPTQFGPEATGWDVRLIVPRESLEAGFRAWVGRPDFSLLGCSWTQTCATTYIMLPENGSLTPARFRARLDDFAARRVPSDAGTIRFEPVAMAAVASLRMNAHVFGGASGLSLQTVLTAFAALVLAVACIDFANLATAESAARTLEVGLRKTVGAGRIQVALQALVEAGLLTALALVLVLPVTWLLAAPLGRMIGLDIAPPGLDRPDYWASVLAIGLAAGLAAGAYPALLLARMRPYSALRPTVARGGSPMVRTLLIGAQFAAASFLIVAVTVMLLQKAQLRDGLADPAADPRLSIPLPSGPFLDTLRAELLAHPSVSGVAVIDWAPFRRSGATSRGGNPLLARSGDPGAPRAPAQIRHVSGDYFATAGIPLLAGADLNADRAGVPSEEVLYAGAPASGPLAAVIDARMAASLGFTPAEAVGQLIVLHLPRRAGQPPRRADVQIVGVAAVTPLDTVTAGPEGYVYFDQSRAFENRAAIVRIRRGEVAAALAHIDETWARILPDHPNRRMFLDEAFDAGFAMFNVLTTALVALSIVSAVIAGVGMFGIAGFVVERRRHEIGVRKALGSSAPRILRLLLSEFSVPVVLANLIAWPAAYFAAQAYLSLFVTRIAITPVPFLFALAITLAAAWTAVAAHAWTAASVRPADVLRHA